MPRINLLPWREELRQKRKKDFFTAVLGAVIVGAALTYATKFVVGQRIENQRARNGVLEQEIATLDQQIEEIRGLENQKERLLARMRIIEELQTSRPLVVHLFDELVGSLPEGMHLTSIEQVNDQVQIGGVATSTTRVASLMRNIEDSEWLTGPQLGSIQAISGDEGRASQFVVSASQMASELAEEGVGE